MHILFLVTIIYGIVKIIMESFEKEIPAENWENIELYEKDVANGVPIKQCIKNAENGKYKLTEKHPEPHRNLEDGRIIIENGLLWEKDLQEYGIIQVKKWEKQGRYNLTPDELKKERERIKEKGRKLCEL